MKLLPSRLLVTCLFFPLTNAQNGLTGLPTKTYDPVCAMACVRSLYTLTLSCSTGGGSLGMTELTTSPGCWATNDDYLTSLAYCMRSHCPASEFSDSKLESFWELQATGQTNAGVQSVPAKWSFAQALAHASSKPTFTLSSDATVLNQTSLVNPSTYTSQYNVLYGVQRETSFENLSGQVLTPDHNLLEGLLTLRFLQQSHHSLFRFCSSDIAHVAPATPLHR
ncbi:unnamed protein product [Periconia digitata]|uniref:Uncharacterized protein n=1 Tax=Periconia digitata TaxID=1303443 RepID=A0A9W4U6F8_9PLEO|nr:unnamed protein product [Periconia digitata]